MFKNSSGDYLPSLQKRYACNRVCVCGGGGGVTTCANDIKLLVNDYKITISCCIEQIVRTFLLKTLSDFEFLTSCGKKVPESGS